MDLQWDSVILTLQEDSKVALTVEDTGLLKKMAAEDSPHLPGRCERSAKSVDSACRVATG
jgi:hypothetical protein